MVYVRVASIVDIPEGKMRQVDLSGKPVLLANVGGAIYAIGGLCTHQKGVLANGALEGHVVTCPRHGSQFDVRTGKSIRGPKLVGIRFKTSDEPAFEVKIEGQDVLLKAD
jgi:3-phenylpropionate/trans-cinnamate dioxygenase ferredoxin subunit